MDESDQPQSVVRRRLSPLQIRVSGLAVVIVCCAVVLWSYRKVREQGNPSIAQARLLRSGDRSEREAAARFFRAPDPGDSKIAAAALIDALKDEDAQVRCEAVRALGVVAKQLVGPPQSPAGAAPAIEALVNVMLDRQGETRAPHSSNLARSHSKPKGDGFQRLACECGHAFFMGRRIRILRPGADFGRPLVDGDECARGSGTEHGIRRDCRGCTDPGASH